MRLLMKKLRSRQQHKVVDKRLNGVFTANRYEKQRSIELRAFLRKQGYLHDEC